MPKKTKRQKKLADQHRLKLNLEMGNLFKAHLVKKQNTNFVDNQNPTISPSFTYNQQIIIKPQTHQNDSNYLLVKYDLIKITIFTFLALSVQTVIYFLLKGS